MNFNVPSHNISYIRIFCSQFSWWKKIIFMTLTLPSSLFFLFCWRFSLSMRRRVLKTFFMTTKKGRLPISFNFNKKIFLEDKRRMRMLKREQEVSCNWLEWNGKCRSKKKKSRERKGYQLYSPFYFNIIRCVRYM